AVAWTDRYPGLAESWMYLRGESRPGQTIAVAGTYLTYPLFGRQLDRRVVHVPVARGVEFLHQIPRISVRLSEANLLSEVVAAGQRNADRTVWLQRLQTAGVGYVLIQYQPDGTLPRLVEWGWLEDESRFREVFRTERSAVFAVLSTE
ncbi:MAG: hypothetical protein NZ561_04710, partial [Phycisphaerae bacterium]|nr:hypothetical protein [Phycisphaerae bacterium]MDW8263194.1 hypothetical protein [Phycisphaerales bacterium]